MKTKHTPGPWTAEQTASSLFVTRAIRGANNELVGHIGVPGWVDTPDVFQNVADAALIAAAPELLECLSAMVDLLQHNNGRSVADLNAWAEKGRAAIQKATGEV